jgi:asparagine synthetase B (glutamine-hydrolysing)
MQADHVRTERYWYPTPSDEACPWLTEAEAGEFESLMVQAVRRCQGPGRTGIFLSGGIDSVTVAALTVAAAQRDGRPLPLAASLGFPHPDCNEEELQRSVAAQLGMPQILLPFRDAVGGRGLLSAAMEMSGHWQAPLQNVWNPAYFRLALQAKSEGCDTILTGSGGDEWLGVDPILAADLIRRGDLIGLFSLLETYRRSFRLPLGPLARNVLWSNGFRPVMRSAWQHSRLRGASHSMARRAFPQAYEARRQQQRQLALAETPGWVAPDPALRRELDERWERRRARPQPSAGAFYLRGAREFLDHPLTSMEFEEAYENGRRLGLRIRHPFWDPDLVQLLYRMPPQLLQQGGRSKGLVRGMLSRRFPGLGFEKQKKVVSLEFFRGLMLEEGAQVWKQIGGTSTLGDLGIVDAKQVDAEITQVLAGRDAAQSYRIWDFVAAEKWARPRS